MLSLDFIRQHPEIVKAGLKRRRDPQDIEELLRLVEQRRGLATRCEGLYGALKQLNASISALPVRKREELHKQIKAVTKDIRLLELQISDIETHMQPLLLALP